MTTPWAREGRLASIAAWDVPLACGAAVTMAAVADRLRSWRTRLDGVWRNLESGADWSGPSARSAVDVLTEVSEVAAGVDAALTDSAAAFQRLARETDAAQASAVEALADPVPRLAAVVVPELRPDLAAAALQHAAAAAAAAEDAAFAPAALGAGHAVTVADLTVSAGIPADSGHIPLERPPREVSAWWAALPAAVQLTVLERSPAVLGRLDGLPAWARDRANRLVLARALVDGQLAPDAALTARAVADRIGAEEAAGRTVQLHLLDLDRGLVAVVLGDLDTADDVAMLVPGIANSPAEDLGGLLGDARDVAAAARAAAPGAAVATMVWLGYRTPDSPRTTISRASAWQGGVALARELAGLAESRDASGRPPSRTTVLAHSYGTVVVDEAADVPGRLAADAVVLLGSPGMEGPAADLEAPEVYDVASTADPVSYLGWFGVPTRNEAFGSVPLPRDPGTGHSEYYDRGSTSLAAMGKVVAAPWAPP